MMSANDLLELFKLIDYVKQEKIVEDTATNICKKASLKYSPNMLWKKIIEQNYLFYNQYIDISRKRIKNKRLIILKFKKESLDNDLKIKHIKFDVYFDIFNEIIIKLFTERNIFLGEMCISIKDIKSDNELNKIGDFKGYEKIFYIERVYVETEFQNKGVGTYIFNNLDNILESKIKNFNSKKVYMLFVDGKYYGEKSDEYLINFYKKFGFKEINFKKNYMIKT